MKGEEFIPIIVEKLKGADPSKIILFGSYAYGIPKNDSDIDILVVTSDNYTPENFNKKMKLVISISQLISDIKAVYPVDLIVHTIPMHQKFLSLGSLFSKEITKKGKVLYEKDYTGVA